MDLLQFEKEYRVHVYETGPDGKLNLYSLFNYMQDIASDHAIKLGFGRDDLMRDNRFWVLSRIYAVVNKWPLWEDSIILKTWPNGTDKLFALRNYEVRYPDGRHIASGTSSWLILDRTTKKVQRPDSILSGYNFDLHSENSPIRYATKIDSIFVAYLIGEFSECRSKLYPDNMESGLWTFFVVRSRINHEDVPEAICLPSGYL